MAEQTPNLNLKKPTYADVADVVQLNDNMDVLDEVIGGSPMGTTATSITGAIAEHETDLSGVNTSIGDTPMGTVATSLTGAIAEHTSEITKTRSDIGIVEDTDVATHTISSGQYVIWHGELYTANEAIPSGTALDDTNLTAASDGGLNILSEQMANLRYCSGSFDVSVSNTDWSSWGGMQIATKDLTGVTFSNSFSSSPNVTITSNGSSTNATALVVNVVVSASGITQVTLLRGTVTTGIIHLGYIASGN